MTRVMVLSDTHVRTLRELPEGVLQAIKEAEWVVHCGDYTSIVVLEELRRQARNFIGVYGNSDPGDIRGQLPSEVTFEIEGRKIAVTHPYWCGFPDGLEEDLAVQFPDADAILFGHTHEPYREKGHSALLLNPGQAYHSFMVPASIGVITISKEKLDGEILFID